MVNENAKRITQPLILFFNVYLGWGEAGILAGTPEEFSMSYTGVECFGLWDYFYLFHLSVISLTSIKALAAIQESRLCKLAVIFSNACNQDLYGHFISENWELLHIEAV